MSKDDTISQDSQVCENLLRCLFHHTDLLYGTQQIPLVNRVLHFTSMTQNGHLKGRHEGKMSALALCSSSHRWRHFIRTTMKEQMTQMVDKDRPCPPVCFLLSAPLCFQFSELRTEEVTKATAERRRDWKEEEEGKRRKREEKKYNRRWESLAA